MATHPRDSQDYEVACGLVDKMDELLRPFGKKLSDPERWDVLQGHTWGGMAPPELKKKVYDGFFAAWRAGVNAAKKCRVYTGGRSAHMLETSDSHGEFRYAFLAGFAATVGVGTVAIDATTD